MHVVNIAKLRGHLSTYLKRVRRGEEILVRDRNTPVAKLVPLSESETYDERIVRLAAQGVVRLPEKPLDWETIFSIPGCSVPLEKVLAALEAEREED